MTMTRKTITIPVSMDEWVKHQVGSGRYGNDSEYFRDLIRHDQEKQERLEALRAAVDVGRQSGISDKSMNDVLREARSELADDL